MLRLQEVQHGRFGFVGPKKKVADSSGCKTDSRFRNFIDTRHKIQEAVTNWYDEYEPVDTNVYINSDNSKIIVSLGDSMSDEYDEATDALREHLAGLVRSVEHCDECGEPDGFDILSYTGNDKERKEANSPDTRIKTAYQAQSGPLDSPKQVGQKKVCPCGSPNGPGATHCINCGMSLSQEQSQTVPNRSLNPGETGVHNPTNPMQKSIVVPKGGGQLPMQPLQQPVGYRPPQFVGRKRKASVTASVPSKKEREEEEEEEEEAVEFKQMLAPMTVSQDQQVQPQLHHDPIARLRAAIKKTDDRTNSFNALMGDTSF